MMILMTTTVYVEAVYDGCESCKSTFPCPDCLEAILEKIQDGLSGYLAFKINERYVSVVIDPEFVPESVSSLPPHGDAMTSEELIEYLPSDEVQEEEK